ncbi:MAG: ATP-binding protein [Bacillota bacterium]
MNIKRVSLQTKIIVLFVSLIVFIITLLTGILVYLEQQEIEENIGNLALQFAKTISYMPDVKEAMESKNPFEILQPFVEEIRKEMGAEFIVIGNADGIRYAHPDKEKIGLEMVGGDNDKALVSGESYTSKAVGSLGPSLRGKAPIINEKDEIIGVVSVGFLMDDIKEIVESRIQKIAAIALIVIAFGIIGGILLARNIQKDILGLEPHEIASLYRERNAILQSVKEGIIAIDASGSITMANPSALEILEMKEETVLNRKINEIIPDTDILQVIKSGKPEKNKETTLINKHVIVNRIPIKENGEVIGVVSSFRDKTEMKEMFHTLLEVKKYSEELRAQTHEFTNKLYVISGLLELGKYEEAIEWIQSKYNVHQGQNNILFNQIRDNKLQALLLGKMAVASEKRITFELDEGSSIQSLPPHIEISSLITIIGNLIDNAMDAVEEKSTRIVTFFALDYGQDFVLEVSDNGPGISQDMMNQIFEKGYSTKLSSMQRGYGLALVQYEVERLSGYIEVNRSREGMTVFSVYLPKKQQGVGEND